MFGHENRLYEKTSTAIGSLFLILLFHIIFPNCSRSEMVSRTQIIMGTFATVVVDEEKSNCINAAFKTMKDVEKALSSFDKEADIYKLNTMRKSPISMITHEALVKAKEYYRQSDGYFNIAIGSVTKALYHFGKNEQIPEEKVLKQAQTDPQFVEFNQSHAKLSQNVFIDMGGFGKGFGVDKAMKRVKQCGAVRAKIALSGDIRCLGTCYLGIEDPFGRDPLFLFETNMDETAISTSGNYRRFVGTKENNHLIDPKTLSPQKHFASITLIGTADNSDIDAWTTAAAVMPPDKAVSFLDSLPVAYVLVYNDKTVIKSDKLPKFVTVLKEPH